MRGVFVRAPLFDRPENRTKLWSASIRRLAASTRSCSVLLVVSLRFAHQRAFFATLNGIMQSPVRCGAAYLAPAFHGAIKTCSLHVLSEQT